jgi:ATP-dependent RNA helicase DDX46/PRP5
MNGKPPDVSVSLNFDPFIRGDDDLLIIRLKKSKQVSEEEAQALRRKKLDIWKAKRAREEEERKRKEVEANAINAPRTFLQSLDTPPAAGTPTKATASSVTPPEPTDEPVTAQTAQTAQFRGAFDPKAIVKKAQGGASATKVLGQDVVIPQAKDKTASMVTTNGKLRPPVPKAGLADRGEASTAPNALKAGSNVSGFGFGSKASNEDKVAPKRAIDFNDEESTERKLEKLPTLPSEVQEQPTTPKEDEGDEDGIDMINVSTEEEAAAAARAAAERREGLKLEQTDAEPMDIASIEPQQETMELDEDIDPLDAYMAGLADPTRTLSNRPNTIGATKKRKTHEPEAYLGDEGDLFDAVENNNPDDILAMASKRVKKKEIPVLKLKGKSHEPFRKSFYVPPSELADMSEEDIADLRLELDGIRIKGKGAPAPVQNWAQCGLGVQSLDVIAALGYSKPTSIQAQAIPAIMSGRDVIGVAKTGSGKTIAFLLPMFRHIKDQRPLEPLEGPIGLIIAPTRELATQIHRDCKPFLKALNLRAACTYGGAPIKDQIADLKRGAEIIVCTPGRIIELLTANSGRVTNLSRVTYTVLDEADRMFDMGFEPQITKLLENIRPDRQTVLFSATFPAKMEALARKVLKEPIEITVGGRSVVAPEIHQIVEVREENTKFHRTLQLLGNLYEHDDDSRTLIFVDRQESADTLLRDLMRKGYPCNSLHGGKDQVDRDSTISDFKAGIFPILVATSVAARGLDVKQLKLVINYDCPNHLEDYVHRVGRTGRAGNKGTAVTFITPSQERYAVSVAKALRQSEQPVPDDVQKMADAFQEKVKSGQEKWGGGGFGGRGIEKYDELRDASRARERRAYKTGDEPEEEEPEEVAAASVVVKARDQVQSSSTSSRVALPGFPADFDPDRDIVVHKTVRPAADPNLSALERAKQAAAMIGSSKVQKGQIRPGQPIDNRGPDAGAFHATLEINDFPQKARWAVTNRTNVAKILDQTGTSITTKGRVWPPGQEPGPDDLPKLYILVEGDTEIVVKAAMKELMRLLQDGTMAAADSEARAPPAGRYRVV